MGSKHPTIAPYQALPTADGYVVVAVTAENFWTEFCRAIDREDLLEDSRFATNTDRVENRDTLDPLLEAETRAYDTERLLTLLDEHDVPASDVKDMEAVFDREQVAAREMRRTVQHPSVSAVEMPGIPMHFSQSPTEIQAAPPRLGEHTEEVLEEFGYRNEDIRDLRAGDVL